jgi:hypothetical protein
MSATTLGWLSRLVLGSAAVAAREEAQETYKRALNGHKFEPEDMRAKLRQIMLVVESKVQALSIPPPPQRGEQGEQPGGHESEGRGEEDGACRGTEQPCGANG